MKNILEKLVKIVMLDHILLLTHTDMDGSGAAVLLRAAFSRHGNVDVEHVPNAIASRTIKKYACDEETAKKYDAIIVCDISCTEEDAEYIDRNKKVKKLVLLDHHATALPLNRYDWALVEPMLIPGTWRGSDKEIARLGFDKKPVHSSGTSLMYDYLEYCGSWAIKEIGVSNRPVKCFTFTVAAYDTWDWKTVYSGNPVFEKLNTLFHEYEAKEFERAFIHRLTDCFGTLPSDLFTHYDEYVLKIAAARRAAYREDIPRAFSTGNVKFGERYYSFVFCYSTKYLQDTFDAMKECHPDADLYIVDRGNGVSIRSVKEDINAGEIAKIAGGGGHPGAGGISIPFEKRKEMLEDVLGTTLYFD